MKNDERISELQLTIKKLKSNIKDQVWTSKTLTTFQTVSIQEQTNEKEQLSKLLDTQVHIALVLDLCQLQNLNNATRSNEKMSEELGICNQYTSVGHS